MNNSGKLFSDELPEWLIDAVLFNLNARCLSIISVHHMDQKLLSYIMLMTVYIGIHLKLLEISL